MQHVYTQVLVQNLCETSDQGYIHVAMYIYFVIIIEASCTGKANVLTYLILTEYEVNIGNNFLYHVY